MAKINRASKAAGPLATWTVAQLHYGKILGQMGPMRKELADMQAEADRNAGRDEQGEDSCPIRPMNQLTPAASDEAVVTVTLGPS